MSQGAIVVANGSGAAVRAAINAALARLQTRGSGTARPADIGTGEYWFETDNPGTGVWSLWLWDGTNDILIGLLDTGAHTFRVPAAALAGILTTQGDILIRGASAPERLAAAADNLSALFSGGAGANPSWVGTWKQLGTANPSAASSVAFTGIPSTVNHLMVLGQTKVNTDGAALFLRTYGADGNVDSGASDYFWSVMVTGTAGSGNTADQSDVAIFLCGPADSLGQYAPSFSILFSNIQAAKATMCRFGTGYLENTATTTLGYTGIGARNETDRITGVQILASSGTLGDGADRVTLFGAV